MDNKIFLIALIVSVLLFFSVSAVYSVSASKVVFPGVQAPTVYKNKLITNPSSFDLAREEYSIEFSLAPGVTDFSFELCKVADCYKLVSDNSSYVLGKLGSNGGEITLSDFKIENKSAVSPGEYALVFKVNNAEIERKTVNVEEAQANAFVCPDDGEELSAGACVQKENVIEIDCKTVVCWIKTLNQRLFTSYSENKTGKIDVSGVDGVNTVGGKEREHNLMCMDSSNCGSDNVVIKQTDNGKVFQATFSAEKNNSFIGDSFELDLSKQYASYKAGINPTKKMEHGVYKFTLAAILDNGRFFIFDVTEKGALLDCSKDISLTKFESMFKSSVRSGASGDFKDLMHGLLVVAVGDFEKPISIFAGDKLSKTTGKASLRKTLLFDTEAPVTQNCYKENSPDAGIFQAPVFKIDIVGADIVEENLVLDFKLRLLEASSMDYRADSYSDYFPQ